MVTVILSVILDHTSPHFRGTGGREAWPIRDTGALKGLPPSLRGWSSASSCFAPKPVAEAGDRLRVAAEVCLTFYSYVLYALTPSEG
jgi:hypothetical protein